MAHLFVDESGDLGFRRMRERGSRYFAVGWVFTGSAARLRKEMQRIRETLRRRGYAEPEVKFAWRRKASFDVAEYVLRRVVENERLEDLVLGGLVLDKETVNEDLRSKADVLRNYLLAHHVLWSVLRDAGVSVKGTLTVVYDRSMGEESIWEFNDYLWRKLRFTEEALHRPPVRLKIRHVDSSADLGIQLADLIAGAMRVRWELGDDTSTQSSVRGSRPSGNSSRNSG